MSGVPLEKSKLTGFRSVTVFPLIAAMILTCVTSRPLLLFWKDVGISPTNPAGMARSISIISPTDRFAVDDTIIVLAPCVPPVKDVPVQLLVDTLPLPKQLSPPLPNETGLLLEA